MPAPQNDDNGSSSSPQQSVSPSGIDPAHEVEEIFLPVKESVEKAMEEKKKVGADKLKLFADAINGAAPGLEEQMPQVANYIREAGAWVEQSAQKVRDQKFEELLDSAGTFTRDNPGAAFAIAALSGFALSRFFKSQQPGVNKAVGASVAN